MLFLQTVPAGTLDLLRRLSVHEALKDFALAGGTSLALRLGHRISVDLDFFTGIAFQGENFSHALSQDFQYEERQRTSGSITAFISGVKVDFITYRYPLLQPVENADGIKLLSLPDVAAMKLSAVTNRGAKKDFYDLLQLIGTLGLPALLEFYQKKYPRAEVLMLLRSLSYFEDAENDPDPISLTNLSWADVKRNIVTSIRDML